MNWNNAKLNEIQDIENMLFNSKDYNGSLRTAFIHKTSEWIDSISNKETVSYHKLDANQIEKFKTPDSRKYKYHFIAPVCMKEITDEIAKHIQQGNNLNVSCILSGYNYNVLRTKFTNEHKAKFKTARELKYNINN